MAEERKLGVVEDTLFVPMAGRIYASEQWPQVLYDEKALELKPKIPASVLDGGRQTQYTYLASASRSANVDRFIVDFLHRKPNGAVVQLGVGLETTFWRCDGARTQWYGVDLPHVIDYRRNLLGEAPRERLVAGSAFEDGWLAQVRAEHPESPLLIVASGLFYYFEEGDVLGLVRMLQGQGDIELLFDTVNKSGMSMMRKKHMKTVGHEDAQMFFYVDSASELARKAGGSAEVLAEESFYKHIPKEGLKLATRVSMGVSDLLGMVKMVHLRLS